MGVPPSRKLAFGDGLGEDSPARKAGILLTPGTMTGRRKQVTFGEHTVNNEGKTPKLGKSGLPDNYPGKFPSPFTPKFTSASTKLTKPHSNSQLFTSEKKTESKFREDFDSKNSPQPTQTKSQTTSRTRDDSDITSDLNFPMSSSGRYWKEQYEQYASRSEVEVKRLISKHKLAKDYARMKDAEALAYKSRFEIELSKRKEKETGLGGETKVLRERLRLAMGENAKLKMEVALLKKSLEDMNAAAKENEKESTQKNDDLRAVLDSKETLTSKSQPDSITADIWLDDEEKIQSKKLSRREGRLDLHSSKPPQRPKMSTKSVDSFEEFMDSQQRSTPKAINVEISAPLGERNPNIASTPSPRKLKTVTSKPSTNSSLRQSASAKTLGLPRKVSHATIIRVDDVAPLEGLDIQMSQPTTPVLTRVANIKRTPRSAGGTRMDDDRRARAQEKIQARKRSKMQIKES